jgi:LmbE family N-acetylglucosaminyl deacetylase
VRHLGLGISDPLRLLVIGAHADDIEIGAGGTILRLLDEHPGSHIRWLILSAAGERAAEARSSAAAFSAAAGAVDVIVGDLPDGHLPTAFGAVKEMLESVKTDPVDLIIGPHLHDAHQDHRLVAEVIWQTFRDHLVIEFEIPKFDGDLGRPNLFVALDEATLERKVALLASEFPSQHGRSWWDADTFRAIARIRGIEAATRFAEAFHGRKVVL